jgi:hypothetical protein
MCHDVERELQLVPHTDRAMQSGCRLDVVVTAIHRELALRSIRPVCQPHPEADILRTLLTTAMHLKTRAPWPSLLLRCRIAG